VTSAAWHIEKAAPARPRRRHTIVVSDVHLSQAHPDDADALWMRYRRRAYHPDADFESLVDRLLVDLRGDAIELVFNGDLFDFDAPWVKDGTSSFDEFPLDNAGCAAHVRRIMEDHPGWFHATARVLAAGHRVLFLSGNHDLELYWPGVRRAIRDHLASLCGQPAAGERVRFRTWFHVTDDGIYLEHGSQYDMLNGVPDPMRPLVREGTSIHPVCGKLAFKRTGSRMGYFNPYYEETFYLGLVGYLRHFAEFYARSPRHIVRTWFTGGVRTAIEVWRHRAGTYGPLDDASRAAAQKETGASDAQIDATHALHVPSAEEWMVPILRELWLDRVGLVALGALLLTLAAALGGALAALVTAVVFVAAFTAYEVLMPKPDIRTYDSAPPSVRRLLDIHDARAMCMGHTHRPFGVWGDDGRFSGNSGSWGPAFKDQLCTQPVLDGRPLLWLTSDGRELSGGLYWWRDGELVASEGARRSEPRERVRTA